MISDRCFEDVFRQQRWFRVFFTFFICVVIFDRGHARLHDFCWIKTSKILLNFILLLRTKSMYPPTVFLCQNAWSLQLADDTINLFMEFIYFLLLSFSTFFSVILLFFAIGYIPLRYQWFSFAWFVEDTLVVLQIIWYLSEFWYPAPYVGCWCCAWNYKLVFFINGAFALCLHIFCK